MIRMTLALSFLCLMLPDPAVAGVRFGLAGTANLMTPKSDSAGPGISYAARLGFGGGVLLEVAAGRQLSLDVGALYVSRTFVQSDALGDVTASYSAVQVPAVVRIWTNPYLSFGLGGHYTRRIGALSGAVLGFDAVADYGVLGSVAIEVPVAKTFRFFVDGRYTFGIADSDTSAASKMTQNEIQALFGFRFGETWIKN